MKTMKKLYYYPTADVRDIIEAAIDDRHESESKKESRVILDALGSYLLPAHPEARFWTENLYRDSDLGKAYEAVFAHCAGALGSDARETNVRPIVEMLLEAAKNQNVTLTGAEMPIMHLISQWNSIIERIKRENRPENVADEVSYGEELLRQLSAEQTAPRLVQHCLQFVIDNWDALAGYNKTYRALVDLAQLTAPEGDARTRCRLVDALKLVSCEWQQ